MWAPAQGEDAMHRLLFEEAPGVRASGRSMAEEVAGKAWASWGAALSQILDAAGPAAPQESGPPGYWSGALLFSIELKSSSAPSAACEFKLWVQPQRAAVLAAHFSTPIASPGAAVGEREPLQKIEAVLAERRLRLAVQLAAVELDLGTLQSLQIDDVIPLPHPLGRALELRLSAVDAATAAESPCAPLCWAHLGRRGEFKAIEVVRHAHS